MGLVDSISTLGLMETNEYQQFYQLYGEWHDGYRVAFAKFFITREDVYAQLMLCFNNFIQEEL